MARPPGGSRGIAALARGGSARLDGCGPDPEDGPDDPGDGARRFDDMATLDRPKLRPVSARRTDLQGRSVVAMDDPLGVAESIAFPIDGLVHWVVRHFDGRTTLPEIQVRVLRDTGQIVTT